MSFRRPGLGVERSVQVTDRFDPHYLFVYEHIGARFVLGIVYMSWAAVGGGREDVVVPLLLPPLVPRLAWGSTHHRVWVGEQMSSRRSSVCQP